MRCPCLWSVILITLIPNHYHDWRWPREGWGSVAGVLILLISQQMRWIDVHNLNNFSTQNIYVIYIWPFYLWCASDINEPECVVEQNEFILARVDILFAGSIPADEKKHPIDNVPPSLRPRLDICLYARHNKSIELSSKWWSDSGRRLGNRGLASVTRACAIPNVVGIVNSAAPLYFTGNIGLPSWINRL